MLRFLSLGIVDDKISSSGSTSSVEPCDLALSVAGFCELFWVSEGIEIGAAAVTVDAEGVDGTSTDPNLLAGRASDNLHIFGIFGAAVATAPDSTEKTNAVGIRNLPFFMLNSFHSHNANGGPDSFGTALGRSLSSSPRRAADFSTIIITDLSHRICWHHHTYQSPSAGASRAANAGDIWRLQQQISADY
jgi:hypothetical protein